MHLNLSFIKNNFTQIEILNIPQNLNPKIDISIDTRTIKKGQYYLALKGENFDGHDFVYEALSKGISGLIVSEYKKDRFSDIKKITIIIVKNTHEFLCALAKKWREGLNIPIVGITGSVGKTTTKEMIKKILDDSNIDSLVSFKNQNNLIGLPLNLLKLTTKHRVGVFELGISILGEMDKLVDVLRPTIAVVTHICSVHVLGLGTLKSIANEKFKIFKYLKSDQIGIFWGDQKILQRSFSHPVVTFGRHASNHIQARKIKYISTGGDNLSISFDFIFSGIRRKIRLNAGHAGFVNNALAAFAVAYFLKIEINKIIFSIESYSGFEARFDYRVLKNGHGFLINDCYNASPQSMKIAIEAFDKIKTTGEKIAVLGDMLELGEKHSYWHKYIGRVLAKAKTIGSIVLVGEHSKIISNFMPFVKKVVTVKNWQEAEDEYLKLIANKKSLTLVKASRAVELDKLVENVVEN